MASKVFINYRRALNLAEAQLLKAALQRHFGKDGVFLDVSGWHSGYNNAPGDGSAWITGDCQSRVLRGGSWNNDPLNLRAAPRIINTPVMRSADWGFRVALGWQDLNR